MAKALLEVETINSRQVENLFKYHSIYAPEDPVREGNDAEGSGEASSSFTDGKQASLSDE